MSALSHGRAASGPPLALTTTAAPPLLGVSVGTLRPEDSRGVVKSRVIPGGQHRHNRAQLDEAVITMAELDDAA
jgi:hypothetical protein